MNQTIYFIEDDPELISLIANSFKLKDYSIICFDNFQDALENIKNKNAFPNIIFSDYMLPFGDGVDFLKKLRLSYSNTEIPFYFVTAVDKSLIEAFVDKNEYVGIINKPIAIEQIRSILEKATEI